MIMEKSDPKEQRMSFISKRNPHGTRYVYELIKIIDNKYPSDYEKKNKKKFKFGFGRHQGSFLNLKEI